MDNFIKVMLIIKSHTCNICHKKFRANQTGRIEIVKRLGKGKIEFWVCSDCAPQFKEKVKGLIDIR